jgi:nucleoside-diphosphate-sugar epimerase
MARILVSIGHGYCAAVLARRLLAQGGWRVFGTTRDTARMPLIAATGVQPILWPVADMAPLLAGATHLVCSAAPGPEGDPFLAAHADALAAANSRAAAEGRAIWIGYLSTTGIYGDHGGAWVDEESPALGTAPRAKARLAAEAAWRALGAHVFRLGGIYGPDRNPIEALRDGTQRRIVKPGQVFSRIHVDDIASALIASMARPAPGRIYNVVDDLPCAPESVVDEAARLLGLPAPPTEDFGTADLSPMARAFYSDSKRVSNARIKAELGLALAHPTYREGLSAILAAGRASA